MKKHICKANADKATAQLAARSGHSQKPEAARRISLTEAQRLAIAALLAAERRRQEEREREAAFWAALEELGYSK